MIGVVGKPSSGKTTFLNALCKTDAKTGNYPFTTIDPNIAFGYYAVPCVCNEFEVNCNPKNSKCINKIRYIPVKIIDVAGLVPGAHEGRGRGNQFLSDLSEADALLHIIDCSGSLDSEGVDIDAGSHSPIEDVKFLEEEIDYWLIGIIKKNWSKLTRHASSLSKQATDVLTNQLSGLKISKNEIFNSIQELKLDNELHRWSDEQLKEFVTTIRKKTKPIIIVANKIDRPTSIENFEKLKEYLGEENVIPASALTELILQKQIETGKVIYDSYTGELNPQEDKLSEKEKEIMIKIKENILSKFGQTGVQKALFHAVQLLDMIVAYPVADVNTFTDKDGNILPDAFLISKGTTAKNFAGKIHDDLEKGFVCAIDSRTKRKLSDNYEMKNNDVLKIMSSL